MMKKILNYPLKIADGIGGCINSVLGAVGLSQFPQYIAQYVQRLGGHVNEAKLNVEKYEEAAENVGKTLEEYVGIHINSSEEVFNETGRVIQGVVERFDYLKSSLESITSASPFTKFFSFLFNYDSDIAAETWNNFTPGLALNLEGIAYAGVGLLAGYGIYKGIAALAKLPFRKKEQGNYQNG